MTPRREPRDASAAKGLYAGPAASQKHDKWRRLRRAKFGTEYGYGQLKLTGTTGADARP
jgi:hypothetical protein